MTYEYAYLAAPDNYMAVSIHDLNTAGALGYRVVSTVSRPGMPDSMLLMREVSTATVETRPVPPKAATKKVSR